jgi:hypothetical protein
LFLRGTLECSIFPLTGYPPTDVAFWQRICRVIKSYGLNHLRFHSWCPPDAAFEAADAEGIIVQVEGPMANVKAGEVPARDAFIQAELQRIVDTYGNHPSFCLMTLGNEYGGNAPLLTNWVAGLIERDPRHLYSSAAAAQTTENRQWTETHKGRGIQNAATQRDLRTIVAKDPRPILGHEIGQWMYFPDFSEIPKWSGVMALKNFEVIRDDMKRKGLLDLAPRFVDASGKFATLLYKEEIEVLLRTPGYGGFSLLDLHDYPTQGTALVGPLNAFWESKGFITPEAFRRFCNSTVPLLRLPKRTYTTDESLEAAAEVAHFGPVALPDVSPAWALTDDMGRTVASGKLPTLNVDTGKLTQLGTIKAPLDKAAAPGKFTITLSLPGFTNDWNIWIYPADVSPVASTEVVVSDNWNAARGALEAGSTVVFFAGSTNLTASMAGKFTPVFWSPVWFPTQKPNTMGLLCDPAHPLLKGFPNDGHSDWQWFNLMQQSRIFVLDDLPPDLHPIVRVIDNFARNHKLGLVFEGRVGEGRLLVCGINLRTMPENPEAMQLLNGLYDYVGSPAFQPKTPLRRETLDARFTTTPPHTP